MSGLFPENNTLADLLGYTPPLNSLSGLSGLGAFASTPRHNALSLSLLGSLPTSDPAFHVCEDKAGEHRWKFKAGNHWIMGDGGESYTTRASAVRAIERFRQLVADAPIR